MHKNVRKIVEIGQRICSLPGKETLEPGPMVHRLRKFRIKSGTELRLEHEQRQKLLVWSGEESSKKF